LRLAAENPDVRAVVVDCAFANGQLAVEESCERWARVPEQPTVTFIRPLGRRAATVLREFGRVMTGYDPWALDPLSAVVQLADRPVFFIHGEVDSRFSPDQARELWRAGAWKDPLWIAPDAGHNECWPRARPLYGARVQAFFARHLLGEGEGLPAGMLD